jgi:hypothetical protein
MEMIRQILKTVVIFGVASAFSAVAFGQFTSGSTGADGAYLADTSGDFDPNNLKATCSTCTANNVVNAAGDNVFNFTTITVNSNVTIRIRASKVRNMPVVWLATGNVTLNGTLNLTGDPGYTLNAADQSQIIQNRRPAEPGAGGYYGGLGSRGGVGPEAGAGPGGGIAGQNVANSGPPFNGLCYGGAAVAYTAVYPPQAGSAGQYYNPSPLSQPYGNIYLVPLYGGSGGGGGWGTNANGQDVGGGGGGGGGAIRIVSTTQITVAGGGINTNGGNAGQITNDATYCYGGPGAGGAIHLIAPTITGAGTLNISSGGFAAPFNEAGAVDGYVRFNVSNYTYTGSINGVCTGANCTANTFNNAFVGPLYNVPTNSTLAQPSIQITQVNGVNVPQPPAGQYLNPDVQINTNNPVTVNIAASNVPVGTVVTLRVTAETAGDTSMQCSPLAGTAASSTASCSATFPFSVSLATLRATW